MKIGDLLVTNKSDKYGIIIECQHNWFDQKGDLPTHVKPNLFYICWIDLNTGEAEKSWHKIDEPILSMSELYEAR